MNSIFSMTPGIYLFSMNRNFFHEVLGVYLLNMNTTIFMHDLDVLILFTSMAHSLKQLTGSRLKYRQQTISRGMRLASLKLMTKCIAKVL